MSFVKEQARILQCASIDGHFGPEEQQAGMLLAYVRGKGIDPRCQPAPVSGIVGILGRYLDGLSRLLVSPNRHKALDSLRPLPLMDQEPGLGQAKFAIAFRTILLELGDQELAEQLVILERVSLCIQRKDKQVPGGKIGQPPCRVAGSQ